MSKMKLLPLPSSTYTEVPICPGRGIGELPMNVTRISSGCTSSVFGNQFAELLSQGIGATPSKVRPSFQRPIGVPPVATAFRTAGSDS